MIIYKRCQSQFIKNDVRPVPLITMCVGHLFRIIIPIPPIIVHTDLRRGCTSRFEWPSHKEKPSGGPVKVTKKERGLLGRWVPGCSRRSVKLYDGDLPWIHLAPQFLQLGPASLKIVTWCPLMTSGVYTAECSFVNLKCVWHAGLSDTAKWL